MTKRRKRERTPPRLFVHGADPVAWAKRYGIEVHPVPCYHCGALLTLDLAFTQGTLRGLSARPCACGGHVGNSRPPWCVVRADGGDILTDLTGGS
jgi:hypothetical protein